MLIAPTEPAPFLQLGDRSSRPEKYGVDFLFFTRGMWVGVQRKEISDLIASVHDGRLAREVAQMKDGLKIAMLIVEGDVKWTGDGVLLGKGFGKEWTRSMHEGLLWSIQQEGIWVCRSASIPDTIHLISMFERWCKKDKHTALKHRPGPKGAWGTPTSRDFGIHLLCGIDGVGPELAGRIWDKFNGVPWAWTVTMDELLQIQGLGPKTAAKLLGAFRSKKE